MNLLELNFKQLIEISPTVTGHLSTALNVMQLAPERIKEEYNLDCLYAARATSLILCGRGMHENLVLIRNLYGIELMEDLKLNMSPKQVRELLNTKGSIKNIIEIIDKFKSRNKEIIRLLSEE